MWFDVIVAGMVGIETPLFSKDRPVVEIAVEVLVGIVLVVVLVDVVVVLDVVEAKE